jgi:hypothetical protein
MEVDPFGIELFDVNLVVGDLVQLGLGMLVNGLAAEGAVAQQDGLGGLLEELTTPEGDAVLFLLVVARDPDS